MSATAEHAQLVLSRTPSGRVLTCACCRAVYIEYGNFLLRLSPTAFQSFANAIRTTSVDAITRRRDDPACERPYVLQVNEDPLQMSFTREEFDEFRTLILTASPHVLVAAAEVYLDHARN